MRLIIETIENIYFRIDKKHIYSLQYVLVLYSWIFKALST